MKQKRFQYRLERVLQYREVIRSEKLRELTARTRELGEATDKLQALEQAFLQNQPVSGDVTVEQLILASAYADRLRQEIDAQRVHIEECRQRVEAAREAYVEAVKEAESLQKHREKKLVEYNELIEKETQKNLDEMTVQRMGQRRHAALVAENAAAITDEDTVWQEVTESAD